MAYNSITRDILDAVLLRLRKPTLADQSVTSLAGRGYERMLLGFVEDAINEISRAWDWHELRKTVTVTVSQGTHQYTLSAAGPADIDVLTASRLLYSRGSVSYEDIDMGLESSEYTQYPMVFDVTDSAETILTEITPEHMESLHFTDNGEQGTPQYFCFEAGVSESSYCRLTLWPIPDEARTIKLRVIAREPDLVYTAITSDGTNLPRHLVEMRVLLFANEERGSNLGAADSTLRERYELALQDSIALQRTHEDLTGVVQ